MTDAMRVTAWLGLTMSSFGMVSTSLAQESEPQKAQVEPIKEIPDEYRALIDTTKTAQPSLSTVFFFRPGTFQNLQSVRAGQRFDMVVSLNMPATSNVQATVRAFRLDVSGLGSGDVEVLPIVTGSAPDEAYWAVPPTSPLVIPSGFTGVRVSNLRVRPDAKQPPAGAATPFQPVKFPDHVIMFVEHGGVVLAPTLRIAQP